MKAARSGFGIVTLTMALAIGLVAFAIYLAVNMAVQSRAPRELIAAVALCLVAGVLVACCARFARFELDEVGIRSYNLFNRVLVDAPWSEVQRLEHCSWEQYGAVYSWIVHTTRGQVKIRRHIDGYPDFARLLTLHLPDRLRPVPAIAPPDYRPALTVHRGGSRNDRLTAWACTGWALFGLVGFIYAFTTAPPHQLNGALVFLTVLFVLPSPAYYYAWKVVRTKSSKVDEQGVTTSLSSKTTAIAWDEVIFAEIRRRKVGENSTSNDLLIVSKKAALEINDSESTFPLAARAIFGQTPTEAVLMTPP